MSGGLLPSEPPGRSTIRSSQSPIYQGSRIWWTRPGERADPRETGARFHYDLYDYRALTFLFYLTDCAQTPDRTSAGARVIG